MCTGANEVSMSGAHEPAVSHRPWPIDLGAGERATAIAAGRTHVCAIVNDARLKCWGGNSGGELGVPSVRWSTHADDMGDRLPAVDLGPDFRVASVAAGENGTCAISEAGKLKCWGLNFNGRLGLGSDMDRGKEASEMGARLPFVDVGRGRSVRAIAMGREHTCAILDEGRVKCWGEGRALGLGSEQSRGSRSNQMDDHLPFVDLGTGRTATAIAAEQSSTCALLDNGNVKCWGWNWGGKLGIPGGLGAASFRGARPGEMGDRLPAVPLGTGRTAKAIAVGFASTCAVLDTGRVKCWGQGYWGDDVPACCHAPPEHMGDQLPFLDLGRVGPVVAISAGPQHACALFDNGSAKCWGANSRGELGIGDNDSRFPNHSEMGDHLPFVDVTR
jgi:E3 ubiquitin-protein ligase HERC3